ncbi:DUF2630 family protein [Streptomonospora nanhaiensis]|uniref:DUF2630 domain-containing protein n=1 Tax=Streptomonospora nanhaiensis TaxID=1323731 RepID=A0A853BI10_9ACTN|nr:DUF2630 family protein [Streptomonospora nanhaiensis]MBV2362306.1 DUF2630 family protein [Streptomonospora nanhaiensis]MBX9390948.1 DUF2630 family protein [Streptomonospora nanhaiensis]NYI95039.1 hypothetical protein [Streptomonospora nanhaiensis]
MSDSKSQENTILSRIKDLVTEERDLREQSEHRLTPEERQRMRALEQELDQCWDLLRQRRAREEFGENPDEAGVRPKSEVEGYRQ